MSVVLSYLCRASLLLLLLAVRTDPAPVNTPPPGGSTRTAVLWANESDGVEVRCELKPAAPLLSDEISFFLCVTVARAAGFPEFPDQVMYSGPVRVRNTRIVRKLTAEGAVEHCLVLKLVPLDRGTVRVGPAQVYLRDPSSTEPIETLYVPELQFQVRTLVPKEVTTAAAEPPVGLLVVRPPMWGYAAAILAGMLLVGGCLVFWLVRRRMLRPRVAEFQFDARHREFLDAWSRLGDEAVRSEATIAALNCVVGWVRGELGIESAVTEEEFLGYLRSAAELPPGVAKRLGLVLPVLQRLKYDRNFSIDRSTAEQVIRTAVEAAQELYLERQMRAADAIGRRLGGTAHVPHR